MVKKEKERKQNVMLTPRTGEDGKNGDNNGDKEYRKEYEKRFQQQLEKLNAMVT